MEKQTQPIFTAQIQAEREERGFPAASVLPVRDQGKTQARQSCAPYFSRKKRKRLYNNCKDA